MNEELTREVLEAMAVCKGEGCSLCEAQEVCMGNRLKQFNILATALLEERAKPKAWDGAPDWAKSARVMWTDTSKNEPANRCDYSPQYTRELPKTRARQIAEKEGHRLAEIHGWNAAGKELVTNAMESAINKYAEELKGEHDSI